MTSLKLIAVQTDIAWENKIANFAKVRSLVSAAAPAKGALIVLPEMFATGFTMNADAMAEDYGGPTEQFLSELARAHECWVHGGAPMRGKNGTARNKALTFGPDGQLISFYAKMRPFSPGNEHQFYQAGTGPRTFEWAGICVAPFICYDLRFPELFRQAAKAHRPELFTVIASWPEKRAEHWVKLLQARAIENQAYVAGVNRVGQDPYYNYSGRSMVVSPQGEIIAEAGAGEGVVTAELDIENLKHYRQGLPFLNDLA